MATLAALLSAAVLIFTFASCQEVALDESNCPAGPGVNRKTVLYKTEATCRCVVVEQGNSSTEARWFTKDNTTVGKVDVKDNSSVLTFSYNSSDPDPTFECRPYTTSATAGKGVPYTPQFRNSYTYADMNRNAILQYNNLNIVGNVTWQVLGNGGEPVNISTCNDLHVLANCTNYFPDVYQGYTTAHHVIYLYVKTPRINETQFLYVADNGKRSLISEIELYAWPLIIRCHQNSTPTYVDHTCSVDNVYPSIVPTLHREEKEIEQTDLDLNYTQCLYGDYGSGRSGDYFVLCNWRIHMKSMLPVNNITVGMSALVSDRSKIRDEPATDNVIIKYTVPEAELVDVLCPFGLGVRGKIIQRGTNATCECQLAVMASSPGQPRWYTKDNTPVGVDNEIEKTSTLTVSYNAADPHPTYTCKPFTEFPGNVVSQPYSPQFSSSMPQSVVTGLQPLIILLGVVLSGIANL